MDAKCIKSAAIRNKFILGRDEKNWFHESGVANHHIDKIGSKRPNTNEKTRSTSISAGRIILSGKARSMVQFRKEQICS